MTSHVCFVCSGNTCRSPIAAVVFRAHLGRAVGADVAGEEHAGFPRGKTTEDRIRLLRSFGPAAGLLAEVRP